MATTRHKVFVSFHEEDRKYRKLFAKHMGSDVVDKSVGDGDIDPELKVDTTRGKIRDEFIADATVTVVLVGRCTWQRKYVDWEIGSSLRKTRKNSRCGLIGILLPTHPDFGKQGCRKSLIPPRLADNAGGTGAFAKMYDWPDPWDTATVRRWIHAAFRRRDTVVPDNSRKQFGRNRSGPCAKGWTD